LSDEKVLQTFATFGKKMSGVTIATLQRNIKFNPAPSGTIY